MRKKLGRLMTCVKRFLPKRIGFFTFSNCLSAESHINTGIDVGPKSLPGITHPSGIGHFSRNNLDIK